MAIQKFLDQKGVEYLWSKISMEDYPNNATLMAVLNAIDETKADRADLDDYLLKEDYTGGGNNVDLSNYLTKSEATTSYVNKNDIIPVSKGGTESSTASGARSNLGIKEETFTFTMIDGTTVSKKILMVE